MNDKKAPPPPPPVQVIVNPTPKQQLMADGTALSQHRSLMQNPFLCRSIELAMAQYVRILSDQRTIDGNSAAANFMKISGATEFISILKSLGETPRLPNQTGTNQIDHKV